MIMKKYLILLSAFCLVVLLIGCSDDEKKTVVGEEAGDFVVKTAFDSTLGYYMAGIDASDTTDFSYYSFATKGVVSKLSAFVNVPADWDIAFKRDEIILNSGESGSGNVLGANIGALDFAGVTIADTSKVSQWAADGLHFQIDSAIWYDGVTHQIMIPGNVYVMFDAGGHNLVKFRVDSAANAGPGSFGDIWMTYFYQSTADTNNLSGATTTGFAATASGPGCFDFSGDSALYPGDLTAEPAWDICFNPTQAGIDVMQNSSANGPGMCSVHPAYQTMVDPTDIDALQSQDLTAKFFEDRSGSVAKDWYNYDFNTHTLSSKGDVFLLKSNGLFYKLKVASYYGVIKGKKASGLYTFYWNKL